MTATASYQALVSDMKFRDEFLAAVRGFEHRHGYPRQPVRENITGPLLDQLFLGCRFQKKLDNGLEIQFEHTGRISREFILAPEDTDHVWEPQTTRLLLHFAKNSAHILIGGAYFGDQALLLASAVRDHGGCVHAFEPTEVQFTSLSENALRNGLTNLRMHQLGLWSASGLSLHFEGADELASPIESAAGGVRTLSVDDYLASSEIESLNVLMIDVEGGEHAVLCGAVGQLSLPPDRAPIVVFETNSRYSDWSRGLENSETGTLLKSHGYHLYAIRDHHANTGHSSARIELIPAARTYIEGPPHGFNMLAIKDQSLISSAPFRIVHDVSPKLLPQKSDPLFEPGYAD